MMTDARAHCTIHGDDWPCRDSLTCTRIEPSDGGPPCPRCSSMPTCPECDARKLGTWQGINHAIGCMRAVAEGSFCGPDALMIERDALRAALREIAALHDQTLLGGGDLPNRHLAFQHGAHKAFGQAAATAAAALKDADA